MTNIKKPSQILSSILSVLCVVISLFHIYVSVGTSITMLHQRVIHLIGIMVLFFLMQIIKATENNKKADLVINTLFIALTAVLFVYYMNGNTVAAAGKRAIFGINQTDMVMGILLMLVIMYMSWRTVGWALTALAAIFLVYAIAGPYMPSMIAHKGYNLTSIASYIAWTTEGVFGTCIGASVSFVALYIIFGELLNSFGAGQFFIDISYALTGRLKGGPAEAAVVSSALMGSINGSAVANVVTTGTFTIPLMKKVGYRPAFAGAVEAVASTGGQLLPPVMGAAAFVMADVTGIPYSTIVIAALIPGLLYYLSLGVAVYLEACKSGLEKEDASRLPQVKKVLKEGWFHIIPIGVLLVCLLGMGLSANYSAVFAIIALLGIGIVRTLITEKRLPVKEITESLISAAKGTVAVTIACASAGIVIGIVSLTGIGVKFTSLVFEISGGNLFAMLFMIMIACIVMGMGLPSTAAYIIAASIGAPALIKAGIPDLAAHLFVFYFAIISFITPPVALSAYAASGIAKSKTSETGWLAFMLGAPGFIIPFIYAYRPAMLLINTTVFEAIWVILCSGLATVLMSTATIGHLTRDLHVLERILIGVAAAFLIFPATWCDIAGLSLAAVMLLHILVLSKKKNQTA